jgi:serine/threonine-protein kinase
VADAVHQAIEKLPADRFATAAEFGAALAAESTGTRRHATTAARPSGGSGARGWPWRLGVAAAVLALLAFFAGRRTGAGSAGSPVVYDAALPDSAPMLFAATTARVSYGYSIRNISVSSAGDFVVYAAGEGDSTTLWYRSLRDATVRPIPGTAGGTAPRVSPDGMRVVFLLRDRVMVAPITGGEARQILQAENVNSLDWASATELVLTDTDGNRAHWLDAEGGARRSVQITRCALAGYLPEIHKFLCSYNRYAQLFDPETGERWTIRATRPDGTPGSAVAGSAFRLVDGRYLAYVAMDGSLLAARYDPATHQAGRPVALLNGIRREGVGEAHYDISASGLLVFAPGVDAAVGQLVRLGAGGVPTPLPVEAGDFQRYDLSRDRRWLAAVAQTAEGNELRIYDLRDGQRFTWLRGELLRHPLWSATGEQILVALRDSTGWLILRGSPSSGVRPDTLGRFDEQSSGSDFSTNLDPVDFHDAHSALLVDWGRSLVGRFDPASTTFSPDTILTGARFPSVSPNGRLIVYQNQEGSRIVVTAFPVPGRRWQLASEGVEPLWLSGSEVLYRSGVSWYSVRLDPLTGEPQGAPRLWARDPRFSDTSGWSNRPSWDGGIIYMQGPEETGTGYLRVVPNWVAEMKAAVRE